MFQKDKQEQLQLDQVIEIINTKHRELRPLLINTKQQPNTLPPKTSSLKDISMPKTLLFKPWSGKEFVLQGDQNYVIKEQIQGIQEKDQDEQAGIDNQRACFQNFSEISNIAKHDEIGYFYKFQNGPVKLIKKLLDENGFKYANNNKNWTLFWSSSILKMQVYQSLLPYQKVNHFPNSFHLTRKDLMNKCISKMQIKYGITNFNFLPNTFILPLQLGLLQDEMAHNPGITYIVKPHNRSQGKGITVTSQLSTILSKLQKYSSLIVSHYIDNPLLINNLKFDLRIYVGITGVNPLRIYVYNQGLGRFATQTYDQTNSDCQNKKYQHLTNYSINKKNTQFVKSEKQNQEYFGSKWSLSALKDFLSFNVGKEETNDLFNRIDDLIIKTMLSGQNILFTSFLNNAPYNNCCYEVLGFDVLIDSNLKPWLMEVNMSPSLNSDSSLDIKIKGNMISEMLTMVGITPLAQRYLDGNHIRYSTKNYKKADNKQIQLGVVQKFVIKQVQSENSRSGNWRRVFPTGDRRYKNYFESDRYFNRLIRQHEIQQQNINKPNPYSIVSQTRQRAALSRPNRQIKDQKSNYASVGEKKRNDSKQKISKFAIRIQNKTQKRVYL